MLEGFLLAPGTIDLSELMFLAVDSFSGQSAGGTGDGGNRRRESADGDFSIEGSSLDLAVFLLVSFLRGLVLFQEQVNIHQVYSAMRI
mgnify:CR=1 FL=1